MIWGGVEQRNPSITKTRQIKLLIINESGYLCAIINYENTIIRLISNGATNVCSHGNIASG